MRHWLCVVLAAAGLLAGGRVAGAEGGVPGGWDKVKGKRVLFFTKSSGFEHSVVHRPGPDALSHSEKVLTGLGRMLGFEVVCTKDGSVFTPENLAKYDVIAFYTSGDLAQAGTDKTPPVSAAGKKALLEAVRGGKGLVGFHSATDSYHYQPDEAFKAHGAKVDPYIALLGGEFIRHGPQQKATLKVIDPHFPGAGHGTIELLDEWYTFKDFAPDLHVIHALETNGMKGGDYHRASFPYTWARNEGKGRVFYTGLAHREDVWENPVFQRILLGGLGWAAGNVKAAVPGNLSEATPGHAEIQKP